MSLPLNGKSLQLALLVPSGRHSRDLRKEDEMHWGSVYPVGQVWSCGAPGDKTLEGKKGRGGCFC